jgi:hypothetical protein
MTMPAHDAFKSDIRCRQVDVAILPPRHVGEPCPRCGPSPSLVLFETSFRTFYQCQRCQRPFGCARSSAGSPINHQEK